MPRDPKGERRPADVNARAVMIAKIATGEIEDKDPPGAALAGTDFFTVEVLTLRGLVTLSLPKTQSI